MSGLHVVSLAGTQGLACVDGYTQDSAESSRVTQRSTNRVATS